MAGKGSGRSPLRHDGVQLQVMARMGGEPGLGRWDSGDSGDSGDPPLVGLKQGVGGTGVRVAFFKHVHNEEPVACEKKYNGGSRTAPTNPQLTRVRHPNPPQPYRR